ncbi:TatD family hydrolase [Candidatus Micrarchaeota archaeon]|nr:TatD family hydrolase [Candidatus Micrarchaeota archaeon]
MFEIKKYEISSDITPVVAGYSPSSNKKAVELARSKGYPFTLGIAPQTAIKDDISKLDDWTKFIENNEPNAIGEVGLDYKWAQTMEDVEKQRKVFKRMIELSDKMKLPLVIHSRNNPVENKVPKNAIDEIIQTLKGKKILMHFFSGTEEQAVEIVKNGGYISVTHLHSKERRKVINNIRLDRLVLESDSPYVGKTPETIRDAVTYIAEIKGIDAEEVAAKTTENAKRFFRF